MKTYRGGSGLKDGVVAWAGAALSIIVVALMVWMVAELWLAGHSQLTPQLLGPTDVGNAGDTGLQSVLVSTALIVGVCLLVAIPLGLSCAIYLSENLSYDSRWTRSLAYSLDVLSAVPSIVFGLFGYQFFAITLGLGFSILAGGLTLACMVLPLMVRISEQALRGVAPELHMAGAALGLSRAGMLHKILLPGAASGISAAIILSLGRALAETAALLFTAGYVLRMPSSLTDSGRALSVHIYDLAMHHHGGLTQASASALVLIAILIALNALVRRLLNPSQGPSLYAE